eukprot:COSAG02_NODE_6075_length_3821_cov_16.445401_3_plen_165_part_00
MLSRCRPRRTAEWYGIPVLAALENSYPSPPMKIAVSTEPATIVTKTGVEERGKRWLLRYGTFFGRHVVLKCTSPKGPAPQQFHINSPVCFSDSANGATNFLLKNVTHSHRLTRGRPRLRSPTQKTFSRTNRVWVTRCAAVDALTLCTVGHDRYPMQTMELKVHY